MRIIRALLAFASVLLAATVVAGTLALYLGATGQSLPLARSFGAGLARVMDGQRTKQLRVRVELDPTGGVLSATAHLEVSTARRRYLYFLLNTGLKIGSVWEETAADWRRALPFYRLGPVAVVDLGHERAGTSPSRIGIEYAGTPRTADAGPCDGVFTGDEVILPPGCFWYPADFQSFFRADVTVTVPAALSVVHNGVEKSRTRIGARTRVRWTSKRPRPVVALVAGRFTEHAREANGRRFRVYLPSEVDLDAERLLNAAADSHRVLAEHYGTDGLRSTGLFVSRSLHRAFSDGAGLAGIPVARFHGGDYGLAVIAHELAHNWWGGTVGGHWLVPGAGAEWLVEGFAEFSSWTVLQETLGDAAEVRARQLRAFNPRDGRTLTELTVLDNALDPASHPVIYGKGALVTQQLAQRLGKARFFAAARALLERFRYRSITEKDLEVLFAGVSGERLDRFFSAWVRSAARLDLALESHEGGTVVRNFGKAPSPSEVSLWRFPPDGNPEQQTVAVGAVTPLGNAEFLVLDPLLETADMVRRDNVFPRRPNPRRVLVSRRGDILIVEGESAPGAVATLRHYDGTGRPLHTWIFDYGLAAPPVWTADGTRILARFRDAVGVGRLSVLNAGDGSRMNLRCDGSATGTADAIYVADGHRLVRIQAGHETTLVTSADGKIEHPVASPDGSRIAYVTSGRRSMDLRVIASNGRDNQLLLTWPRGPLRWRWVADGSGLFVVLAGDWDWQLWEVPLDGRSPRALVREAADMTDLAVSRTGRRAAIVAAPDLHFGRERHPIFVVDADTGSVRRYDIDSLYAHSVAWLNDTTLATVISDPITAALPRRREMRRVPLPAGEVLPFP